MNKGLSVGWFLVVGWLMAPANVVAQDTIKWSDIDCSQSKIIVPAGVKCRGTQDISGGTSAASGVGAGGSYRNWSASGTVNGAKLNYFISEATAARSSIRSILSLDQWLMQNSPQGKGAKNFSASAPTSGGDYVTFTSAAGESCVGVRKYGTSRAVGYSWILYASRCAPGGKALGEADASKLLAETGYKG